MDKDNKLEEVQNIENVEENILTEEDLLKEELNEVEMNEESIFGDLDGEELAKNSLEEDLKNEEENKEEKNELIAINPASYDKVDEDYVEEIASNGIVVVSKKKVKNSNNLMLEGNIMDCDDYKEIKLIEEKTIEENEDVLDIDNLAEEELHKENLTEEDLVKEELTKENKEKEEIKKAPKKSIFSKIVEKVKKTVCHPVKTIKKVGNKIADGFIFISTHSFLVILGTFVAAGYLLRHPIKSVKNIFHALRHPVETYRNLKSDLEDTDDYSYEEKSEMNENTESNNNKKEECISNSQLHELDGETLSKENTESNTNKKEGYIPPIALLELEGEELVREKVTNKEHESTKTLESLVGEEISKNKSSKEEINENKVLTSLDGEELNRDLEKITKGETLQRENGSVYNLNRNSGYENKPIDASEINVNRGSVNLYEEAVSGLENRESKYENQTSGKPYIKIK